MKNKIWEFIMEWVAIPGLFFLTIILGFGGCMYGQQLPDCPKPQRVIDKKFVAVMGTLAVSESLDLYSTALEQGHGFVELDRIYGHHPTDKTLVLDGIGIYAAEVLIAYEIKKPHHWLPGDRFIQKLWFIEPTYNIGLRTTLAAHNFYQYSQYNPHPNPIIRIIEPCGGEACISIH